MAAPAFESFRRHVLADRALQDALAACASDRTAFAREAAAIAAAAGFAVEAGDIEREIDDARHEWRLRWV